MMSLVIEMKGPVAIAGSIFILSNVKGTRVPNMEANMTTANRLSETEYDTVAVAPNRMKL